MHKNYEAFSCQRGTLTIRGRVYGCDGTKKPAVILSHGFLGNLKSLHRYATDLSNAGYICFTYDFCGGGLGCSSDGRTDEMSVLTEKEDLRAVTAYVKGRTDVAADRVTLLGCSQGGYVSAMTAAEHPVDYERLVLFYPALCIPDDARKGQMMFYRFDPERIPNLLGRFPMRLGGCYARAVVKADSLQQIKGYPGPVLILHGTVDRVVNVRYSEAAAKGYDNCRFVPIWGADHGFKGKRDNLAVSALLRFLRETERA